MAETASGLPALATPVRIIVKPAKALNTSATTEELAREHSEPTAINFWRALGNSAGKFAIEDNVNVMPLRPMSGGAWVATISGIHTADSSAKPDRKANDKLFRHWQRLGLVDYALNDSMVTTNALPDDPLYSLQWHLGHTLTDYAALNLPDAWDVTQGAPEVVVAIIDTGVRFENSEMTGRLLPGYDFVSGINDFRTRSRVPDELNFIKAHDGDGRDADATDPGDGVDAELSAVMQAEDLECPQQQSTWHGTAMASLIAANGSDALGMTGVDWGARILPVRAIGKCGGRRSDLLDAIRWAAGVSDPQLPENPTPARVINLSLGIDDACNAADQQAIDDATAMGSLIVAAVGNLGRNLDEEPSSPSHCDNVLGVTAVDSLGYRASYSSYGNDADIAAPGGEGPSGDNRPILIATNDGFLEPRQRDSHRFTTGTSVASPLVAGVLSLMLSVNPDLSNAELRALLKESTKPFPGFGNTTGPGHESGTTTGWENGGRDSANLPCTKTTCGSGLVDAHAAVVAAQTFDPTNPGSLIRVIQDNESVFKSGGSASTGPLTLLILFGWILGWILMAKTRKTLRLSR